jgi:hypothetical protein
MKFIFCFLCLLFTVQNTHSATWTKTFGGEEVDEGYAVVVSSDTSYLVAGYTRSFGSGGSDAWILKADRNGNLLWQKTLGGALDERVYSADKTLDGGYILTGYTEFVTTIDKDVWLIKLDSNGDTIWTKGYDIGNEECGYCVKQTADSGYVVVGYSKASSTRSCVLLMKTNAVGGTVWIREFASFAKNRGYSVCQTSDAGYVITGFTKESSQCMLVIKTDSTGNVRWSRVFDTSYDWDYGGCIRQSLDSCYVVAGILNGRLHLLKLGEDGDTLWVRDFGGSRYGPGYGVGNLCFFDFARDSSYVVVGCCGIDHCVNTQLVKTDREGKFEWRHVFGGSEHGYERDYVRCVRRSLDGGYVMAGATESYAQAYSSDLWLIRTDAGRDVEEETAAGSPREIFSLYPNPATLSVRVTLSPQRASPLVDEVRLTLYDITGREIRTVIDSPTNDQIVLHLAGIKTGTYFVKAVIDNQIVTKKLSVVAF